MSATLKPCPFCGSTNIDPSGWASTDRAGPACDDCAGSADTVELWNSRPLSSPRSDAAVKALKFIADLSEEAHADTKVGTGAEVALRHIARRAGAALAAAYATEEGK